MESMTSQSIEEGNEDATVVDGGGGRGGGAFMRVDGWIDRDYLEALYDVQRDDVVDALGEGRHRG